MKLLLAITMLNYFSSSTSTERTRVLKINVKVVNQFHNYQFPTTNFITYSNYLYSIAFSVLVKTNCSINIMQAHDAFPDE